MTRFVSMDRFFAVHFSLPKRFVVGTQSPPNGSTWLGQLFLKNLERGFYNIQYFWSGLYEIKNYSNWAYTELFKTLFRSGLFKSTTIAWSDFLYWCSGIYFEVHILNQQILVVCNRLTLKPEGKDFWNNLKHILPTWYREP